MTRREKVGAWLDTHPLVWYAIVGAPISAAITAYMQAGGSGWLWSLYGGVFGVLIGAVLQEWAVQRAHTVHAEDFSPKRLDDMTAIFAENRKAHGVDAWDWRVFVGFAIGSQIGSALAVIL